MVTVSFQLRLVIRVTLSISSRLIMSSINALAVLLDAPGAWATASTARLMLMLSRHWNQLEANVAEDG